MSKNKNPALADDYPIRTERDVAIEQEMREARRSRHSKQPSKERPDTSKGARIAIVTALTRRASSIETKLRGLRGR